MIMCVFGVGVCVLRFCIFRFFSLCMNSNLTRFTVQGTKITVYHCSRAKKILKMGLTVLFTHLKIILLQYLQFSVFSFSNNKIIPNGPHDKF